MNILKDRAISIVLVLIIMAGATYMVIVDPDRVDAMDEIVERDDTRIADVNEVKELYDRLDLKLDGTKKHLKNLWDLTEVHIKDYNSKVDSIDNAFSKFDLKLDKLITRMDERFSDIEDEMEELDESISSVKKKTTRDIRSINVKLADLEELIKEINTRLDEEEEEY